MPRPCGVRQGLLVAVALTGAVVGLGGCSSLLDFQECSSHYDCYQAHSSIDYACSPEGYCVYAPLESSEHGCKFPEGLEPDESSLVFATLVTGINDDKRKIRESSARLAFEQINDAGGLDGHEFAVLVCSPEGGGGDPIEAAMGAARHIVDTMRIPAVIGAGSSSHTLELFPEVFEPAGILTISPSATAAAISFFDDHGLLWRTAPSDLVQGEAMAAAVDRWAPNKVAFIARPDAYGEGLRDTFSREYCSETRCREDFYLSRVLPDASQTDERVALRDELLQFLPSLIVVAGYVDDAIPLINAVENRGLHPAWLLSDGCFSDRLITDVGEAYKRIRGTRPLLSDTPAYNAFLQAYRARFEQDMVDPYGPHAYDAAFMLAYGAAALAGAHSPTTGPGLAEAFSRLGEGKEIEVGQNGWNEGARLLGQGADGTIDLVGASGDLDMNDNGEPNSAVSGWLILDGHMIQVGEIYSADGRWIEVPGFDLEM